MEPFVIPLDKIEEDQLSLVGGKALNLARLRRSGFKVPEGFVLTTALYREASRNSADMAVPADVQDRICEYYRRLSQTLVAVRSSASHEDSATASFAGQGQTILNVSGEQSLLEAISAVWRSLESSHVREYARQKQIQPDKLVMAVVVQELVDAEVSGVMFTINPVTGDQGEMVINAIWGLGEPLVSGKVTPDEVVIDAATQTVKRTTVGSKELALNASGHEVTDRRPAEALCLNDEIISQLIESGDRLAEHFHGPQDIEWAWSEVLYVLQTRPLTTMASVGSDSIHEDGRADPTKRVATNRRTTDDLLDQEIQRLQSQPRVRSKIWAAKGMAETLPCPTPLSWEVASRFMSGEKGYGLGQRWLGFDPARGTVLENISGHIYVDLQRESGLFFQHAPIGLCVKDIEENPIRAAMPRQVFDWRKLSPAFLFRSPQLIVQGIRCVRNLHRQKRTFLPFFRDDFLPVFEKYVVSERAKKLSELPAMALAEVFEQRLDHFLTQSSPILTAGSILAAMSYRELEDLLIDCLGAEGIELAQQLTTGLRPSPTLEMHEALLAVAHGYRSEEDFVSLFGHRCDKEFELAAPRWREEMAPLQTQIKQLGETRQPADAVAHAASVRKAAETKLGNLQQKWGRVAGELVWPRVLTARKFFPLREETKDLIMREYELLRSPLVELDRRLDLAGGVFYLRISEIQQCAGAHTFSDVIARRRHKHALAQRIHLPQVILGSELVEPMRHPACQHFHRLESSYMDVQSHCELRGVGVSSGRARGQVRLVRSSEEISSVQEGDILVVESLDATWTSAYARAVGLVAERGATLSHGAIVAREFGIPAVVNVAECTDRLQTGQMVEVDGSKGSISRIPSETLAR